MGRLERAQNTMFYTATYIHPKGSDLPKSACLCPLLRVKRQPVCQTTTGVMTCALFLNRGTLNLCSLSFPSQLKGLPPTTNTHNSKTSPICAEDHAPRCKDSCLTSAPNPIPVRQGSAALAGIFQPLRERLAKNLVINRIKRGSGVFPCKSGLIPH